MRHIRILSASFLAGFLAMCAFVAGAHSARGGSEVASFVSPLSETIGGTHQSTYTTGDVLYASASNTLSKLAIGTSNQLLTVSGGVPVWSTPSGVSCSAIYGDGSDGSQTWDGSTTILSIAPSGNVYTLTRDIWLASSTVNNGVAIVTAGWRIYGTGTLTNNGTIKWNGNNGTDGVTGTGGTGGAALASQGTGGGAAGGAGGSGAANGTAGSNQASNAIGGAGGHGGDSASNTGGVGGTITAPVATQIGYNGYPSAQGLGNGALGTQYVGGAGGGGGAGLVALGGGGGGSGGGVVLICFKSIDNTNGTISANGGNGGNGQTGSAGRGEGGGGGVVFYTYNTYTGTTPTATKGANGATGTSTNATNASDGVVVAWGNNQ